MIETWNWSYVFVYTAYQNSLLYLFKEASYPTPVMVMDRLSRLTSDSDIVADADLLSLSGSWTDHTSTTIGLGALSGRAIMSVGELVLKGVKVVRIRKALHAASLDVRNSQRHQPGDPLSNRTIISLLELQR